MGAAGCALALACGSHQVSSSLETGLASSHGPVSGAVSLADSSATVRRRAASTRGDGTFSIDVADLTPPYLLEVEFQDGATASRLYAVSAANDPLDINPITDALFAGAAGPQAPETIFRDSDSAAHQAIATGAEALLAPLRAMLAPLFARYGVTNPRTDRAAVALLLADVVITRTDGTLRVVNRATGGVIFVGELGNLAAGTFTAANLPGGPGPCTAFTYSDWGACSVDGSQTRAVLATSPPGCSGGAPVIAQACAYAPPTCTAFTYSDWGACSPDATQARSVVDASPAGCLGGTPVLVQACVLDGQALYTEYCAQCHGPAQLFGDAPGAFALAIQSVAQMQFLSFLTPAQLVAIGAAGAPPSPAVPGQRR